MGRGKDERPVIGAIISVCALVLVIWGAVALIRSWTSSDDKGAHASAGCEFDLTTSSGNTGELTDAELIALSYYYFLGREPDERGMASYIESLHEGEAVDVHVYGFGFSDEFGVMWSLGAWQPDKDVMLQPTLRYGIQMVDFLEAHHTLEMVSGEFRAEIEALPPREAAVGVVSSSYIRERHLASAREWIVYHRFNIQTLLGCTST